MNFKNLLNTELVSKIKNLITEERKLTIEILHYLREIEVRRIYSEMGYSSLFEFCMKELSYSEGATHRRISAMRLLKEIPEIEQAVETGKLTLSTVSQIQVFSKQENYSKEQKKELVFNLQGKSTRECEKVFATLSPESLKQDKERPITETHTEVKFVMTDRLKAKLEKIKALTSHKNPNPTYAELLEQMADLVLEKINPEQKPTKSFQIPAPRSKPQTRYISQAIKTLVWKRDQGRCSYIDMKTGRKCTSNHLLQIDHKVPFAQGGPNTLENLRLLCASHNQFAAIQKFGSQKMQRYLSPDISK